MILKECFSNEFIESKAGVNIEVKKTYEKVVHAFYLLEKLSDSGLNFIFKGGTSLMLLLKEFNRFSVDIDILMEKDTEKEVDLILKNFEGEVFTKVEEDIRKTKDIIKKHYKFYYKTIYPNNHQLSYVLLDIVFDDYSYQNLNERTIESDFVKTTNPLLSVKIPSIDEMLGDKLTAFAPNTIGILYRQTNQLFTKYVEIVKQLYDISKLLDHMKDINVVKETYNSIANIQMKNRNLEISNNDCLIDSINTCKLILSQGKKGDSFEKYDYLMKGYDGFKHYTVSKFKHSDFLIAATKTYILCIKLLCNITQLSNDVEKPINTFIGKQYKYIRQNIGEELYNQLMRACYLENNTMNNID